MCIVCYVVWGGGLAGGCVVGWGGVGRGMRAGVHVSTCLCEVCGGGACGRVSLCGV